ncbi:MAG TPA: DUF1801 domain-containing protein [Candidatus Limnocylindrales bacterium]|nr:DUF1801 domain-containing protein [Candidatus Limnocylindrales bacterium]
MVDAAGIGPSPTSISSAAAPAGPSSFTDGNDTPERRGGSPMTSPDDGTDPGFALPVAMTGRASPAKAAVGDKPVFAYIGSLPQPQRSIAERIDVLAAKTLPDLQRSVKWGMAWYGVGDGWCFSCGGFAGHVKLTFGRGTALTPVPPVTPIGMGKDSRGVDLESVDDIDERQLASWMKQAAAIPGFGKR